ncbi:4'-phosphopantetheinyl transferase family protein [Marinobacter changyiensis]|uniref:4'-phosphopantetheinyl transferase family protein n=1 Tax=Marinobacter changyiensis TaxID=2604091 RepID=UPI001263F3CD|nr:4'-phosphopantetheinyl transferase superfamily protein [Marinobacter changyiensis]
MAPDEPLREQLATRLFLSPPPATLPPLASRITDRWISFLSDAERDYLERQRGKRYREYLLSRALLRQALSLTLSPQVPPSYWQIRYGTQAPPAIEGPGVQGWHCTLSHSAGRVAIALSNQGACGVDTEIHRFRRNRSQLVDSFFTAGERALLDRTPESERETVFYRLWTLKEAWYKTGTQDSFSEILSGLDFSTPTCSSRAGSDGLKVWWQEVDGYSLSFAGHHKPTTLTQLLPDEEGVDITNQLHEFIANPGPAE